jgi:quinolinate synthase
MNIDRTKIVHKGFVEEDLNPSLNLFEEIEILKKKKNAVILAHYYQEPDIQDIADFVGDSLALAQQAKNTNAEIILFAGVHFMAETAKILNPDKKVIVPDLNAGCSLADSCPVELFKIFLNKYPDFKVISYINCTADIKALSDVIVTSSNAKRIIESYPLNQNLIFAPDKNLGAYLNKVTGRNMVLWPGSCMVHNIFAEKKLLLLKQKYPTAIVVAHPECQEEILVLADFIGSTSALLDFVKKNINNDFIVCTESGILHQMKKNNPDKNFVIAPTNSSCACNDCPHMKLNTIEKIYLSLKYELPVLKINNKLMLDALKPIEKMLSLS